MEYPEHVNVVEVGPIPVEPRPGTLDEQRALRELTLRVIRDLPAAALAERLGALAPSSKDPRFFADCAQAMKECVRAARDCRFKYIRHYRPDLPYLLWIPYRNRHPILQEMWRLHMAGELEGPQALMFQPRPAEELYDTQADPFEIDNLAGDPACRPDPRKLTIQLDELRTRGPRGFDVLALLEAGIDLATIAAGLVGTLIVAGVAFDVARLRRQSAS